MTKTGWTTLLEVSTRIEAEMIKEALEAQEIPAEIFQEGLTHYVFPGALASVEVCVPAERLDEARAWLVEYDNGTLVEDESSEEEENPGEDQ